MVFLIRIAIHRGLLTSNSPRLILLSSDVQASGILNAWARVPSRQGLELLPPFALEKLLKDGISPLLVALSSHCLRDSSLSGLIERLDKQDPRQAQIVPIVSLFEQQQERLPPSLLPDSGLSFDDLPWAAPFSVQCQLKRLADLLLAAALLFITAPFPRHFDMD